MWIGVTDWLTAEIDLLPLVGGLFTKPNLPVPSFNFRFKLRNQDALIPAMAYETMFQYLYTEFDQSDNSFFATWRKGSSWYHHVNASWRINRRFYMHASAGATYAQYLKLQNKDSGNRSEKEFYNRITPDVSLALDYRFPAVSFHLTTSYGTTFNYIDNVPRKVEVLYGLRAAPFYKNKHGVLKNFRFEWVGFYNAFPAIDAKAFVPVFIPYLYWQWQLK